MDLSSLMKGRTTCFLILTDAKIHCDTFAQTACFFADGSAKADNVSTAAGITFTYK